MYAYSSFYLVQISLKYSGTFHFYTISLNSTTIIVGVSTSVNDGSRRSSSSSSSSSIDSCSCMQVLFFGQLNIPP